MTSQTDWAGPHSGLVDELLSDGFVLIADDEDKDRFGNVLVLMRRGETRVRAVRDRSQWFLEIAGPGGEEWFSPVVWRALVTDDVGSLEVLSPEQEDVFIRERLNAIDRHAADTSGVTLTRLREWRAKRAAARRAQPSA